MEPANNTPQSVPTEPTTPVAPEGQGSPKKGFSKKVIFFLVSLFMIIIFLAIGYMFAPVTRLESKAPSTVYSREVAPQDKEEPSQIYSYLSDSAFSKWSGSVGGILTEKNEQSFKIEPITEKRLDGGVLLIEKVPDSKIFEISFSNDTTFYFMSKEHNPEDELQAITYADIPLNTIVRGGVNITYVNDELFFDGVSFSVSEQ